MEMTMVNIVAHYAARGRYIGDAELGGLGCHCRGGSEGKARLKVKQKARGEREGRGTRSGEMTLVLCGDQD